MTTFNNINEGIQFGTDGWRAIIADSFTHNNVIKVANAIGKYVLSENSKKSLLLIGYDTRFLSKTFAELTAHTLINLGIEVYISDTFTPTPVIAYLAANFHEKTCGAIQFTASHNPPKYCGLKFITNYGGPAPEEITNKIVGNLDLQNEPIYPPYSDLKTFETKKNYYKQIKKLVDFNKIKSAKIKVVYDPLYGAGQEYFDELLIDSGCETITLHKKRDPLFGNILPEPKEEFLHELKNEVLNKKARIGLATDGDSDRLGVLDSDGVYYSPNKIASMLLRHLIKNKNMSGGIARTLSTTHLLDHIGKKNNIKTFETKVGFKWLAKEFITHDILIGAEESGGISIKGHVPDKDAILSGMLIVEMIACENKSLKEIYNDTIKESGYNCLNDRFDLHIEEKIKVQFLDRLKNKAFNEIDGKQVIDVKTEEGAKYLFDDGSWFFARASGTEPMARVYFESTNESMLNHMKSKVKDLLTTIKI